MIYPIHCMVCSIGLKFYSSSGLLLLGLGEITIFARVHFLFIRNFFIRIIILEVLGRNELSKFLANHLKTHSAGVLL